MTETEAYQHHVAFWAESCFGEEVAADKAIRNFRFIEEALELVQACGCSKKDVLTMVDYTFGRPTGEPSQEVGGVMVTLAALCEAQDINMGTEGLTELQRCWEAIDKIREKQKTKPHNSPLPGNVSRGTSEEKQ